MTGPTERMGCGQARSKCFANWSASSVAARFWKSEWQMGQAPSAYFEPLKIPVVDILFQLIHFNIVMQNTVGRNIIPAAVEWKMSMSAAYLTCIGSLMILII